MKALIDDPARDQDAVLPYLGIRTYLETGVKRLAEMACDQNINTRVVDGAFEFEDRESFSQPRTFRVELTMDVAVPAVTVNWKSACYFGDQPNQGGTIEGHVLRSCDSFKPAPPPDDFFDVETTSSIPNT